jgi:predicted dehydrogenase
MKAAVVGCGDVSEVHFAALADLPHVELVAVCDRDEARRTAAATAQNVPGFGSVNELLDADLADVIHVCTPHNEHVNIATLALQRGVHVLLEKPLADSVLMGSMLVDAAATSSAMLGVCFQNRYNPTSVAFREALTSGTYGKPLGARAQMMWARTADYYRARPWRGTKAGSGGGVLMNQAIHTIDLVQWLLGDVTSIRGTTAALMFGDVIEVEDTAVGVLEHESGVRTNFYATLTHFEHAPVFIEVTCEQAVLVLNGDLTVRFPDGRRELLASKDVVSTARTYWGASHERLITDFYAGIAAGKPFWINAEEAAKSLKIAQAFYA